VSNQISPGVYRKLVFKNIFFCNMTQCKLVEASCWRLWKDFLRNIAKFLPDSTRSQPRRQKTYYS